MNIEEWFKEKQKEFENDPEYLKEYIRLLEEENEYLRKQVTLKRYVSGDKSMTKEVEYKIINNSISTLATLCTARVDKIIDLLTGYLWDEEEAGGIKRASQPT